MYIALISIIIFVCILLILVVLSQNSKGGGLSSQFGAGSSQLMGVKRTGDLLEKLTWGFAIGLVLLTLTSHIVLDSADSSAVQSKSVNIEKAQQDRPAATQAPVIPQNGNSTTNPAGNNAAPGGTAPAQQPAVSTPGVTVDSTK